MKLAKRSATHVTIDLSTSELVLLNNALNEVCNGVRIDDFEFQTRLGATREEALLLLSQIGAVFRTGD